MPTPSDTGADTARGAAPPDGAETFDPAQHLTADGAPASETAVYLELACSCGAVRKQFDPPAYLARTVQAWNASHAGPGHTPASVADAVTEREARREAAHRASGRAEDYQANVPKGLSTQVTTWPDLSTAGTSTREG